MRTGACLHHASCQRQRETGAAGGEAGDYAGIWRDAAVAAAGGQGARLQMVLGGEVITAAEAYRIGLVNEVTAAAELIPRAEAIAAKIVANAPLAVQYAMEAVNKGMEMTLAQGLFLEATLFGVCCATE